jgi:hypothetical protein
LTEPHQTGFLDKLETLSSLFGPGKTEWQPRYCLLKDDGFFWLGKKSDKVPKGVLCVSDPGVSISLSDSAVEDGNGLSAAADTILVITLPSGRRFEFKASSAEEMQVWIVKIKMAKVTNASTNGSAFLRGLRKQQKGGEDAAAAAATPSARKAGAPPPLPGPGASDGEGVSINSASRGGPPGGPPNEAARAMAAAMMGVRMPFMKAGPGGAVPPPLPAAAVAGPAPALADDDEDPDGLPPPPAAPVGDEAAGGSDNDDEDDAPPAAPEPVTAAAAAAVAPQLAADDAGEGDDVPLPSKKDSMDAPLPPAPAAPSGASSVSASASARPSATSSTTADDDADSTATFAPTRNLVPIQKKAAGASAADAARWTALLTTGALFTKYKYKSGKKRMIWASPELDRVFWGDEKKKKEKGHVLVADLTAVRHGAEGSKKPERALTLVSATRLLELEAPDQVVKDTWMRALQWLIGADK